MSDEAPTPGNRPPAIEAEAVLREAIEDVNRPLTDDTHTIDECKYSEVA